MENLKLYHWLYGRHSNIPDCCIEFWVTHWENILATNYEEYDEQIRSVEFKLGKEFEYRPCPECLKNKRWNPIHKCSKKTCERFHRQLKRRTGYFVHSILSNYEEGKSYY